MKNLRALLMAAFLLMTLGATTSFAEREEIGRVVSMTPSKIVIELADGDKLRLEITGSTKFYLEGGGTVRVKRLLPDSKVRVSYQDGRADAIHIKAVPK